MSKIRPKKQICFFVIELTNFVIIKTFPNHLFLYHKQNELHLLRGKIKKNIK